MIKLYEIKAHDGETFLVTSDSPADALSKLPERMGKDAEHIKSLIVFADGWYMDSDDRHVFIIKRNLG